MLREDESPFVGRGGRGHGPGEGGLGQGLGRGTPGFWQGAFQTFMVENAALGSATTTTREVKGCQEGQFDNAEQDNSVAAELGGDYARTLDEVEGQTDGTAYQGGENDDSTRKQSPLRRGGGNEAESSPSEDKKSIKNRYDPKVSQEKRRQQLLDFQKQRRDEMLDKIRNLDASSDSELEEDEDFVKLVEVHKLQRNANEESEQQPAEKMDTAAGGQCRRIVYKRPTKKRQAPCRVMLSEWLLERPDDFEENWMGILCPVGKRCLVVASRSRTCVYSRTFEYMGMFQSHLPGGRNVDSRDPEIKKKKGVTILDCIWSMEAEVFYVLDLVCWASQSYNNCDKAYRQFFQTSKISENPSLMERHASNPYPFLPLPSFECSNIAEVMMTSLPIFKEKVDGVLLFHKESFYINGVNPLCLWIYLTDMEEKLQISVSPEMVALQRLRASRRHQAEGSGGNGANGNWRRNAEKQNPMEVQSIA